MYDVLKRENGFVLVDTDYNLLHGWETLVFPSDANGNIEDLLDLDCEEYASEEAAKIGHNAMVERWTYREYTPISELIQWYVYYADSADEFFKSAKEIGDDNFVAWRKYRWLARTYLRAIRERS